MILETVRRHYKHRYPEIATAWGEPHEGQLGVPPGPGLGVELKKEFLESGRVQFHSMDESRAKA
jgi:L-alanine-DL-glutamate epimerase-like enolase superfamily enzyme